MTYTVKKNATAFNQGSDARLSGTALSANPYGQCLAEHELHYSWLRGWRDVHKNWAKQRPRYLETPLFALPPIRED